MLGLDFLPLASGACFLQKGGWDAAVKGTRERAALPKSTNSSIPAGNRCQGPALSPQQNSISSQEAIPSLSHWHAEVQDPTPGQF